MSGQLKVRVLRGVNLAIRDIRTSDPYVVVKHGKTKLKTRVIKKNVNPEWNEDLNFHHVFPSEPVTVQVFDKDRFSRDDSMGDATIDIRQLIELANIRADSISEDNSVFTVIPNRTNSLAARSSMYLLDGIAVQDVILRLNNVECGELELQLQWIK